jgi:hypothetical protein
MTVWRSRAIYVALALVTICVGLLVHLRGTGLDPVVRDMCGDALWATMIAWWIGALAPLATVTWRGVAAYAICAVVEISQAFHTPTLDAVRATRPGQLVLGSGFDPRDFVAYAIGVGAAVAIERMRRRSRTIPSNRYSESSS